MCQKECVAQKRGTVSHSMEVEADFVLMLIQKTLWSAVQDYDGGEGHTWLLESTSVSTVKLHH